MNFQSYHFLGKLIHYSDANVAEKRFLSFCGLSELGGSIPF